MYISSVRGNLGNTTRGGLVRKPGQRYFGSNSNISDLSYVSIKEQMKAFYNPTHFNEELIHIVSDS
jgi:hypothetical protein